MGLDELIILGMMLLAIVGSWIGNVIKEAQQKETEKERQARGQPSSDVDDAVAQRRERLRQMARERQQRAAQTQQQYQRYGELESTAGGESYTRYSQIDEPGRPAGYQRYEDVNAAALEQQARNRGASQQPGAQAGQSSAAGPKAGGGYQRYRQPQERDPQSVQQQLQTETIRRGRKTTAAPGQRTGQRSQTPQQSPSRSAGSQTAGQRAGATDARQAGTGAPSHEQVADAMQRDARMRQATTVRLTSTTEAPQGQPTPTARRIRGKLTSGNVRDFFIIKELFDKPMAMRDQLGIHP